MYTPTFDYFLIAAEELNFSRAAEKCHVTQQSLSNYIRRLEQHYGTKLFDRTPSLLLTAEGKKVVLAAQEIQNLMEALQKEIGDLNHRQASITIGIANPLGKMFSRMFSIPRLADKLPDTTVTIMEDDLVSLVPQLHNGSIDFLISSTPSFSHEIQQLELRKASHFVLISEPLLLSAFSDTSSINEFHRGVNLLSFARIPMVLYTPGGTTYNQISAFFYANGITLSHLGAVNNPLGIIQEVSEQSAWGYCPEDVLPPLQDSCFWNDGVKIYAFPIVIPDLSYSVLLSYKAKGHRSPGFQTVLAELTSQKMETSPAALLQRIHS